MNFKGYGSEIPIIDDKTISLTAPKKSKKKMHIKQIEELHIE